MKIKKGDNVLISAGKDRGKKGKVSQVFPSEKKIVVENINKMIRHVKPKREGEKGQRIEFFAPIDVSNVMLICPKCGKTTKVGFKIAKGKEKQRICKKCNEAIS